MAGNNKKKRNRQSKNKRSKNADVASQDELEQEDQQEIAPETELDESKSTKRQYEDDDDDGSDAEEKPQKKKKKKQPTTTDGPDKKGKKSIRQMKREKHAQRQAEAQASAKDNLKSQCLNYLSQWKHDKQNWKFMKAKQVWLYKNKFSSSLLPDSSWPLLLEYFESAVGNIRNMLLEDANKVIKQMDEWTESQNSKNEEENDEDTEETPESKKPNETTYKRARDLIQCLQE